MFVFLTKQQLLVQYGSPKIAKLVNMTPISLALMVNISNQLYNGIINRLKTGGHHLVLSHVQHQIHQRACPTTPLKKNVSPFQREKTCLCGKLDRTEVNLLKSHSFTNLLLHSNTLWSFNIAIDNDHIIADLPIKHGDVPPLCQFTRGEYPHKTIVPSIRWLGNSKQLRTVPH